MGKEPGSKQSSVISTLRPVEIRKESLVKIQLPDTRNVQKKFHHFSRAKLFSYLRNCKKMISSNSMEPNSLTDCWTAKVYNRKSSKWIWLIEFHRVIFSPLWGGLTGRYHFWIDPSKLFSAYQNKTVHYGSLGLKLHLHRPNVVLDNMTTFYRNIHLSINYRLTIHDYPDVTFDVPLIDTLPP